MRSGHLPTGSSGGLEGQFSKDPLPELSAGSSCEQFRHGQGCPFFDAIYPAFPLPTTASPILRGALKYGFEEAVVACDMPELCTFPSLDSCQKKFLWTYEEADIAPYPIVDLVLQVEDREKLPHALGFKSLDLLFFSFSESASRVHVSQP